VVANYWASEKLLRGAHPTVNKSSPQNKILKDQNQWKGATTSKAREKQVTGAYPDPNLQINITL
jgi:hypothetical protein